MNTIRFPSGDQEGQSNFIGAKVSCVVAAVDPARHNAGGFGYVVYATHSPALEKFNSQSTYLKDKAPLLRLRFITHDIAAHQVAYSIDLFSALTRTGERNGPAPWLTALLTIYLT